jgi:transcriptional regulator with XRE-family HTH domain
MAAQPAASFAVALRAALESAGLTQATLARELQLDPAQVSRWINGKAVPNSANVRLIEKILSADLADSFSASTPKYELYVSAPVAELNPQDMPAHHDAVAKVASAAGAHVNSLYWPGERFREPLDIRHAAADILTEQNMVALNQCSAFLYLQFAEIVGPSSALIELGYALARHMKITMITQAGLTSPYMLKNFSTAVANLNFLPNARIYSVASAEDASALISANGRALLGLT